MSLLSSQEFEECGACFYLSSHVYQRVLKESTQAFLLPKQRVFRMQAGWLEFLLLLSRLLFVWVAVFLSSFLFFSLSFCLSRFVCLFSHYRMSSPSSLPSFAHSLARSQLSTITPSLIILPLFSVFYWSPSLPNSLSPFQIPCHMVHQCNPLPRYLIIKAVWLQKGSTLHWLLLSPFPYTQ